MWAEDDTFDEAMLLDPDIQPSTLMLVLGAPDSVVLYRTLQPPGVSMFLLYPEYQVMVLMGIDLCSAIESSAWEHAHIFSISIGDWQARYPFYPLHYDERHILDGKRWATELRALRTCE